MILNQTLPPLSAVLLDPNRRAEFPFRAYLEQLDRLARALEAAAPSYGSVLPAATGLDGRLFVVTPGNALYQLQAGAWVAL